MKLENETLNLLTYLLAVSLAQIYPMLESVPGLQTESEVAYGLNSLESLASYDHEQSSWKTSQASLWQDEGLTSFSESFPKWGMMRSGSLYALPMLVHRTSANDGSVWVTPVKSDNQNRKPPSSERTKETANGTIWLLHEDGSTSFVRLSQQVKWATPKAQEVKLFPTPQKRDHTRGSRPNDGRIQRKKEQGWTIDLNDFVKKNDKRELNPQWVETLMGFPQGYVSCYRTDSQPLPESSTNGNPHELSTPPSCKIEDSA